MYVGDGGLIDIVAKDSGQARIGRMSRLMGTELSAKKRHLMASIGGPSGACTQFVVHDTAAACDFWSHSGLIGEIRQTRAGIRVQQICTPAAAFRLRDVQTFVVWACWQGQ